MVIDVPLIKGVKILVKEKDKVKIGQPLWEYEETKNIEIDAARQLKIKPNNIFDYLKKFINDQVKKNDILALKKTLFGHKKILAPFDGFVKEINHESGIITLSTVIKKSLFLSFFKGEIENVNEKTLRIKIINGKAYPLKNKTALDYFGGKIFYMKNQNFTASDVNDKIVFTKKLTPIEQIKAEALGVKGFISLNEKAEESETPIFIIKNLDNFDEIEKEKKTTCIILKNESKIVFYD